MRVRLALPLVALLVLAACEAGLDAPATAELSERTRTATDVLPADASIVGKIDVQATRQNPNLDPLNGGPFVLGDLQGEAAARVASFLDATGFDPETDLREVYFALEVRDGVETPSLAVYAALDRERIAAYVDEEMANAFTRSAYRDVPVYTSIEDADGETMTFALASDELIVASPDAAAVRAMLDRLADGGRALKDDARMMELVQTAAAGDAWFVAQDLPQPGPSDSEAPAEEVDRLGRAVQDVVMSFRATADGVNGDVMMTAREGVSADDLASLTKGAVSAMKSAAKTGEHLAALDDVDVRTVGDDVRVRFTLNNAFIAAMH